MMIMDDQTNMEERLWDYMDGVNSATEKMEIEKLIQTNLEWKNKYQELLEANQWMSTTPLEEPSMRFTKNVMDQIAKYQVAPATRNYINKKIIWGIGGFFLSMMFGFLVYSFSLLHFSGTSNPQLETAYNQTINKIDWAKYFSNTYVSVFMMVNIVLGLMFLDLYLNRNKEQHKNAS
jgi:hypothetical protein